MVESDLGSTGGLSKHDPSDAQGLGNQADDASPTPGADVSGNAVSTRSASKRSTRTTRSTKAAAVVDESSAKRETRGKRPSTRAQSEKGDAGAEKVQQGVDVKKDVKKPRKGDTVDTAPLSESPKVFGSMRIVVCWAF